MNRNLNMTVKPVNGFATEMNVTGGIALVVLFMGL
tara:strand:+ start:269 stop:373 length:105 start_codon:yes stop_codon:yes gene_type:complete